MMNLLAQAVLAKKKEKEMEKQKEIDRQQAPAIAAIECLVKLIEYQKSYIQQEMYNKYIDGITAYTRDSLVKLKYATTETIDVEPESTTEEN